MENQLKRQHRPYLQMKILWKEEKVVIGKRENHLCAYDFLTGTRCGNVRKESIKCTECPNLYCTKCAEKMYTEFGEDIFTDGCPVVSLPFLPTNVFE
jgi:late competence protein required for DNA uptake (superfamily II DNA/RNA helicase)